MTLASVPRYDPEAVSRLGDRAIVVGGSIAGLSMAPVLADAFDEVLVMDRDTLPDGPVPRDGAPQTRHPHALLEAGRATFEDLFPGFSEAILTAGGVLVDSGTDMTYYDKGGYVADTDARLPTYCATRGLIEHIVRQRVADIPSVTLQDDTHVIEFETDADASSVTGVSYRHGDKDEQSLSADLVIDATGRTSPIPTWLENHGYQAPPVEDIEIDVSYSTIRLERPENDRRLFLVPPDPPRKRGAAFIPVEEGQWEVIVQGVHDEDTPRERSSFIEFVESLPVDAMGELLRQYEWDGEAIDYYPFPSSRRRRYEELDAFPDRLVVTGDAIASFNPIYGQGMSIAALDALQLHHTLADDGLHAVGPRFFERTSEVVDAAWQLVVGADFAFPETAGSKPTGTDLSNWYTARLLREAHADSGLSEAFLRVLRLERPAESLLRPGMIWRVLGPG